MNLIVCVSHVPDTTARITIASDQRSIDPAGVKFILNPYDEFAVEEALKLRETHKGEVTVISVGADPAKEAIRQALAMGADKGILVKSDNNNSFNVAHALAETIRPLAPDLILMGKQSIDSDGMEVPAMLSELLQLPAATVVVALKIENGAAVAEKEVEGGRETVSLPLPAIIAAQKGLNDPRYPSLPNIMKAKQKPIQDTAVTAIAPRTTVVSMNKPDKKRTNKILKVDGNAAAVAAELAQLLHTEAKVI